MTTPAELDRTWRKYRRDVEWQCRWLELRMQEIDGHVDRYQGMIDRIESVKRKPIFDDAAKDAEPLTTSGEPETTTLDGVVFKRVKRTEHKHQADTPPPNHDIDIPAEVHSIEGEHDGPSAAEIEAMKLMEAELTRPLSAEQADVIKRAYAPGLSSEVVACGKFTGQGVLEMTRKDVATMATGEWLNDEMVNFTIGTMADREMARCGGTQPRVHFFNTFFVGKLTAQGDGYDYNAVRYVSFNLLYGL